MNVNKYDLITLPLSLI